MVTSKFSGQDKLPFTAAVLVTLLRAFLGPAARRCVRFAQDCPNAKELLPGGMR